MQHDDPAYLDGLSELDRARAIVAVRWCGARWLDDDHARFLTTNGGKDEPDADPTAPIGGFAVAVSGSPLGIEWGDNWTGTASLMQLAESRGWILANTDTSTLVPRYQFGSTVVMSRPFNSNQVEAQGDTIHAAVLLACAAACQREVGSDVS